MALGRRTTERQQELWIPTQNLPQAPRHVFYETLNRLLAQADFDRRVEDLCEPYYADKGRPGIAPGIFFRMLLIGYFENISSQRGIAWRCDDSRSLRRFLGIAPDEETPDHSSLTRIKARLPWEVFQTVFAIVLELVAQHKLLDGRTVGIDATTLEADAAMNRRGRLVKGTALNYQQHRQQEGVHRSDRPCRIVRKDTDENWEQYVRRLAAEDGVEIHSQADLIRYDKQRKKTVSNEEWESPHDPDARITKMKDGTTHLAYKAEHVVDLKTEAILAAEVYHADQADSATLINSLERAEENLERAEIAPDIEKVVADKGYHKAQTLADCGELNGGLGIKTYIPEPESNYERVWTDKPQEQRIAVCNNRRRTAREHGKRLQRRRSEVLERSFAHVCETGGMRRMWSHGLENARKRYTLTAAAHNLGLILRKLLGWGKPREFAAMVGALLRALTRHAPHIIRAQTLQVAALRSWQRFVTNTGDHNRSIRAAA
jgi:transposase